jgi:hypothetical protein
MTLKIILSSAILLASLYYLVRGLSKKIMILDGQFILILYRFNYVGTALAMIFLLPVLFDLFFSQVFTIAGILVILVCLTLNAANRYLYRIPDEHYPTAQVRMALLLLCTILLRIVPHIP